MTTNNEPGKQPAGSEHEISDYFESMKQFEMDGYAAGIKKARTALFITAGLLLLGEIFSAVSMDIPFTPLLIAIIAAEVGVFVGLALWTKHKPLMAIIIGIILYIGIWVLSVVISGGQAAFKGIVVRIVILAVLIGALRPAKAWEDAKRRT